MIVDRRKLLSVLIEKGITRNECAKILKISYTSFINKMNGKVFTEDEIYILVREFGKSILLY